MMTIMPIPPSGQQFRLRRGDQEAIVTEVGAGLRTYTVGDWSVIDGYPEDEMAAAARGAVLLPWPNRIEDGRYEFAGLVHQLPLTEPDRHNAIHGLTRWLNWSPRQVDVEQITLGLILHPQPGYPFTLDLDVSYRLDTSGLAVRVTARNIGSGPLPFGAGHHPYLSVGTERVDDAWLRLPARARLESDNRLNATGQLLPVAGTAYDFREGHAIGPMMFDMAFTDLDRERDGLARIELRNESGSRRLVLWLDAEYRYLMVYSGDTLEAPRRRRSLALEPMTCGPNAFRRPALGLRILDPGETATATWGLAL